MAKDLTTYKTTGGIMRSILKAITWSNDGKANMAPQKRAEVEAFYKKYAGKNIEVVFRVLPRRSIKENKYYWVCVIPMLKEAMNHYGNEFTDESCHEFCKERFNGTDVINSDGVIIGRTAQTTTDLNNEEFFNEYIESIRRFAAEEFGLHIPDPEKPAVMFATYENDLKATIVTPE